MKSLCVIVGPVCSTDCNLRQGGCEEHQFGFGNGHPDFRHPDTDMGNRVFRKTPDRSQGVKPSHLAFPDSVRCCYGAVVVVLFQGHSDRRCLQSGPIDKLSVVFTIIFAFLFLHERVGLPVVIGAILIAAGSILMLSK